MTNLRLKIKNFNYFNTKKYKIINITLIKEFIGKIISNYKIIIEN